MSDSDQNSRATDGFGRWVDVSFDCVPLRTVSRVNVPLDASPKLAAKMLRLKSAIETHGTLNTYFLHNAKCVYHLTNSPDEGMLEFEFDGVVLTDSADIQALSSDLRVELVRETCSWVNQGIVDWLAESVVRAVLVEFNRYTRAGDLEKTVQRIERLQQATEESGGFVGMYL